MNNDQRKHYRCQLSVQDYLDKNTTKWNNIVRIVNYKNSLDEIISRVQLKDAETSGGEFPVTQRKESLKASLAIKASALSGVMQSYCHEVNNMDMLKAVTLSKSDIERLPDTGVDGKVRAQVETARQHLPELADFGITEEGLDEVLTTLDEFNTLIGKPRVILNNKYITISSLDSLVSEGMDILKNNLDNMMLRYRENDPEFYDGYQRAREIVG